MSNSARGFSYAVLADAHALVGLLGTAFTMEQDFYRDRLASHGLRVLIPPPDDRAEVHRIIYDELCLVSSVRRRGRPTATPSCAWSRQELKVSSSAAPRSSC